MQQFFITFGYGQFLAGCYTIINAEAEQLAREEAETMYGPCWSMIYDSSSKAGVQKYNLSLVPWGTPNFKVDMISEEARVKMGSNLVAGLPVA